MASKITTIDQSLVRSGEQGLRTNSDHRSGQHHSGACDDASRVGPFKPLVQSYLRKQQHREKIASIQRPLPSGVTVGFVSDAEHDTACQRGKAFADNNLNKVGGRTPEVWKEAQSAPTKQKAYQVLVTNSAFDAVQLGAKGELKRGWGGLGNVLSASPMPPVKGLFAADRHQALALAVRDLEACEPGDSIDLTRSHKNFDTDAAGNLLVGGRAVAGPSGKPKKPLRDQREFSTKFNKSVGRFRANRPKASDEDLMLYSQLKAARLAQNYLKPAIYAKPDYQEVAKVFTERHGMPADEAEEVCRLLNAQFEQRGKPIVHLTAYMLAGMASHYNDPGHHGRHQEFSAWIALFKGASPNNRYPKDFPHDSGLVLSCALAMGELDLIENTFEGHLSEALQFGKVANSGSVDMGSRDQRHFLARNYHEWVAAEPDPGRRAEKARRVLPLLQSIIKHDEKHAITYKGRVLFTYADDNPESYGRAESCHNDTHSAIDGKFDHGRDMAFVARQGGLAGAHGEDVSDAAMFDVHGDPSTINLETKAFVHLQVMKADTYGNAARVVDVILDHERRGLTDAERRQVDSDPVVKDLVGERDRYDRAAHDLNETANTIFWDEGRGCYSDLDMRTHRFNPNHLTSAAYVLRFGKPSNDQRIGTARMVDRFLVGPYGVRANDLTASDEQWDADRGWPPHADNVVEGLLVTPDLEYLPGRTCGDLACRITENFMRGAVNCYAANSNLPEKNNVDRKGREGHGGDYATGQDFEWMMRFVVKYAIRHPGMYQRLCNEAGISPDLPGNVPLPVGRGAAGGRTAGRAGFVSTPASGHGAEPGYPGAGFPNP